MYKTKPHLECTMPGAAKLRVTALNGSLKHAPDISNTEELAQLVIQNMGSSCEIASEIVRLSDQRIPVGLGFRESKDDDWPGIVDKIKASDIVLFATPVWWGGRSSLMQRVIERLDALDEEYHASGRSALYNKMAGIVITGSEDGAIHVWSVPDGRALQRIAGTRVTKLAISGDGKRVAAAAAGSVSILDATTGATLATHSVAPRTTAALDFSTDGRVLLVRTGDSVRIWAPDSHRIVDLYAQASGGTAVGPDGASEVFGDAGGAMVCRVGEWTYPMELCASRISVARGLVARTLAKSRD